MFIPPPPPPIKTANEGRFRLNVDFPYGERAQSTVLSIATKMVSGRAKTVPVPLCGESVTCRLWAHVDLHVQVMGVVHGNKFLPRRGQLQNCLERVLVELDNNLWAQVESQRTCTDGKPRNWTVLSIGRVGNAFIHYFISSYAFLLLAAKTARTPRSWLKSYFLTPLVLSQDAFRRTFGLVFGATNSKQRDTLAFTWKRLQGTCSVSYLCRDCS